MDVVFHVASNSWTSSGKKMCARNKPWSRKVRHVFTVASPPQHDGGGDAKTRLARGIWFDWLLLKREREWGGGAFLKENQPHLFPLLLQQLALLEPSPISNTHNYTQNNESAKTYPKEISHLSVKQMGHDRLCPGAAVLAQHILFDRATHLETGHLHAELPVARLDRQRYGNIVRTTPVWARNWYCFYLGQWKRSLAACR